MCHGFTRGRGHSPKFFGRCSPECNKAWRHFARNIVKPQGFPWTIVVARTPQKTNDFVPMRTVWRKIKYVVTADSTQRVKCTWLWLYTQLHSRVYRNPHVVTHNSVSHCVHTRRASVSYGFSPVWTSEWQSKLSFTRKTLPQ